MLESGYSDIMNVEAREDLVVIVSCGTFEFPVDEDGSLSLSTIQTQLPFASGLWYWSPDQQRKRAVKYDRTVSKLFPPPQGWGDRTYYVALLDNPHAGCVSGFGLDRYERATRLFQESVHSVSRLIGYEHISTNVTEQDSTRKLKEILDAPLLLDTTTADLQKKCDDLTDELRRKNIDLNEGEKSRREIEQRFDEILKELEEAKRKVLGLETVLIEKERTHLEESENFNRKSLEFECRIAEMKTEKGLYQQDSLVNANDRFAQPSFSSNAPYSDGGEGPNDKQTLQNRSNEIRKLQIELESSRKQQQALQLNYDRLKGKVDDSEMVDLRKIIEELKLKCEDFEAKIVSKDRSIDHLTYRNVELESEICSVKEEYQKCKKKCKQFEETIHALHQFSIHIKKEADDAKWRNGELENALKTNNVAFVDALNAKQMNDAKSKCGELEAALRNKCHEANFLIQTKNALEIELIALRQNTNEARKKFSVDSLDEAEEQPNNGTLDSLREELTSVRNQLNTAQDRKPPSCDGDQSEIIKNLNRKLKSAEQKYAELLNEMENRIETEKENSKWRHYELETALAMLNKELEEIQEGAARREEELLNEIDCKTKEIEDLKEILQ